MKGKLLHDKYTNVVYLSPWLRYEYENQNHLPMQNIYSPTQKVFCFL